MFLSALHRHLGPHLQHKYSPKAIHKAFLVSVFFLNWIMNISFAFGPRIYL